MGRGEDTNKMPSLRREKEVAATIPPLSPIASRVERKPSLVRFGGRYLYLDANNNTDMTWLIDHIKHENYKNESTSLMDENLQETARFSRQGVFAALNKENTAALLENLSEILNTPLHRATLTTANRLGQVDVSLDEKGGGRGALLRLVSQPGIVLINESDIERDALLLQQEGGEQKKNKSLDRQGARIYRDGLKRELIENKHPETLIFFVTDWQSAADIKESFTEDGRVIQIKSQSPAQSSHIINETTRVLAEEDYLRLNLQDEDGQRISRERFGLHLPTPPVHPDSRCQVIHLHNETQSQLPLQEIRERLAAKKEDKTFVLLLDRELSSDEMALVRREASGGQRIVVVTHPTDNYGSNVDVDHISY